MPFLLGARPSLPLPGSGCVSSLARRVRSGAFAEVDIRERVKQAGGTWNPERRVWQLRYDSVVALGLNRRIANEPASTSGCQR